MRRFLVALMFLVVSVSVVYGGWFPITAWGIKYNDVACTTWVAEIDTGWHGNSIMTYEKGDSAGESIAQ